eukprot:CAMPEP_0197183152 /NCGR_PEP_ID=MMETSP1423-20130617/7543_1 /TAXON_ID=476441 /ORGANISM="Pseudo-nitzschia heimii, Strain UNC1101" /LENGTH=301 /DNA_ID=CAMNT_0042633701 /DNA_START=125 /DNA_END=1027 /DNA_ORIENTATION=-
MFEQAFGASNLDLYEDVLHVSKDCTPSQLRKGYYKQALKYHPDKNKSKDAKLKFQAISWAYSLLKDPNKRKQYDSDGIIPYDDEDDETNEQSKKSWKDYFDLIFGKVSTDDIDSFARKYKMSDEEEKDVLENYVKFKGNLKKMLEFVMLSEERDISRWIEDYIQPAIQEKKVDDFKETLEKTRRQIGKKVHNQNKIAKGRKKKDYSDPDETETEDSGSEDDADDKNLKALAPTSKEQTRKKNVARKTQSRKVKIKVNKKKSENDLIAAIRNKKGRGNPLASIAAKYGVSAIEEDPIDDEEF